MHALDLYSLVHLLSTEYQPSESIKNLHTHNQVLAKYSFFLEYNKLNMDRVLFNVLEVYLSTSTSTPTLQSCNFNSDET